MKVLSVNVGLPQEIEWRGRIIRTAIWKEPVQGPVRMARLNLDGDAQADLRVHGGPDKAVYLYPKEHYPLWEEELGVALLNGAMGENLTTQDLLEDAVAIGDRLRIGTALTEVAQPRLPCFKLGARHLRPDLPKVFVEKGLPGVYLRVVEGGEVEAESEIRAEGSAAERWTVSEVSALLTGRPEGVDGSVPLEAQRVRLAGLATLGAGGRRSFQEQAGFYGVIGEASPAELAPLADLLEAAGLPSAGFPGDTPVVLSARDADGGLLGGVALELHGDAALLRSAGVAPKARRRGIGGGLVAAALRRAHGHASSVSILTETAPDFFARFGFREVDRAALPTSLQASAELQGACPDSAVVMIRE